MADRDADVRRAIRDLLSGYPVEFNFGMGGRHPFVEIETPDRRRRKITFTGSRGSSWSRLRVQADLRRTLKELGVAPFPERRREDRIGGLGAAILDAVTQSDIEIETEEVTPMATTLSLPAKTNGSNGTHAAPAAKPEKGQPREYTKLRQHEVVQLTVLIAGNAKVDYAGKAVDFNEGWGDKRLLDMLRAAPGRELLTLEHIVNFRRENFGLTASEREAPAPPEGRAVGGYVIQMRKKIASLESRVQALEDAMTAPKQ
jgi:hypothetical protein